MIDNNTLKALKTDIASMLENRLGFLSSQNRKETSPASILWELPLSKAVSPDTIEKMDEWLLRNDASGTLWDARLLFELRIHRRGTMILSRRVLCNCILFNTVNISTRFLDSFYEYIENDFQPSLKDISAATDSLLACSMRLFSKRGLDEGLSYLAGSIPYYGVRRWRFLSDVEVAEINKAANNNGFF